MGRRPALDKYLELGYVPADNCHCWGGAAETLEDAAADYGLSELSRRLGSKGDAKKFLDRSGNWTNVFDANATEHGGYIRDRKSDGSWAGTFTPGTGAGFVEGSSARYTWMVYADVAGLAGAMGGNERATERLDAFFRTPGGAGPAVDRWSRRNSGQRRRGDHVVLVRLLGAAPAASADHTYIHGLKVNGRTSTKPWVGDSLVEHGGRLDFTLGTTPDTTWGSAPADAPPR